MEQKRERETSENVMATMASILFMVIFTMHTAFAVSLYSGCYVQCNSATFVTEVSRLPIKISEFISRMQRNSIALLATQIRYF